MRLRTKTNPKQAFTRACARVGTHADAARRPAGSPALALQREGVPLRLVPLSPERRTPLDAGLVRVRKQLGRDGDLVEPKTPRAVREVGVMPALVRMLRAHREEAFARGFARATDFVFASETGSALHYRNVVRRGLDKAVKDAQLDGRGRVRFHDLRHTFASLLIAQGLNVVFVSRQLGHSSPNVTLTVYAHLFDRAEHGQRAKDAMEAGFGRMLAGTS